MGVLGISQGGIYYIYVLGNKGHGMFEFGQFKGVFILEVGCI